MMNFKPFAAANDSAAEPLSEMMVMLRPVRICSSIVVTDTGTIRISSLTFSGRRSGVRLVNPSGMRMMVTSDGTCSDAGNAGEAEVSAEGAVSPQTLQSQTGFAAISVPFKSAHNASSSSSGEHAS